MSIFLAVTINMAMFSFVLEQILPSPYPRGFHIKVTQAWEFTVGMFFFCVMFFLLSYVGYRVRNERRTLYAARVIGGHLTAFAGITTFGTIQIAAHNDSGIFSGHHYLILAVVTVILLIVRGVSHFGRKALVPDTRSEPKGNADSSSYDSLGHKTEESEWRLEVCEAEDDATSLIMAFLVCQVIVWQITGSFAPLHHATPPKGSAHRVEAPHVEHDMTQIRKLCMWTLSFAVVLVVAMFVRKSIPHIKALDGSGKDATRWSNRIKSGFQTFAAMEMSWCLMRMGHWFCEVFLRGTALDSESMDTICNAFLMTMFAVFAVILLDRFADTAHVEKDNQKQPPAQQQTSSNSKSTQSNSVIGFDSDLLKKTWKRLQAQGTDVSNLEKALRTIIDSFGLLVGLCWEKATDAAIETIIEGNPTFENHKVISKISAAIIVTVVMFPAWIYYVIPPAEMTVKEHENAMELANLQEQKTEGDEGTKREELVMSVCKDIPDEKLDELFDFIKRERNRGDGSTNPDLC
jgi:hypothetical protein